MMRRKAWLRGRSLPVAWCAMIAISSTAFASSESQQGVPAAEADTVEVLEQLAAKATRAVVLIAVRTQNGDSRQGSGFLVDSDGLILTNHHVVRDARTAEVRMSSGDVFERVSILGIDERRDIAVIRVPGFGLPALPLGNSDSVRIGASVIAIGSPMGLENTVSTGIVSGRRQEPEGYQLIQITAPASPGSSGGPVLNRDGSVFGIAAAQFRRGQNLNFAVPINYARGLLAQLPPEPILVLSSEPPDADESEASTDPMDGSVNRGIRFGLDDFGGYEVEREARRADGRTRRTRVTVRRLEDLAGGPSRIERFEESETILDRGDFGTPQVIQRVRRRTLVDAADLQPISTTGRIDRASGEDWTRLEYRLEFEGQMVRGSIRDSTGVSQNIDREIPPGTLLRDTRHLAFATLLANDVEGRSVELITFDPETAQLASDRYDIGEISEVHAGGSSHRSLRVRLASGLFNSTAMFRSERPRILLRESNGEVWDTEEVIALTIF